MPKSDWFRPPLFSGLFRYVRNPMHFAVVSLVWVRGRFSGASAFLNTVLQFGPGFQLFVLICGRP